MNIRKFKKKYFIGFDTDGKKLYHGDIVELQPYDGNKKYLSPIYLNGRMHGSFVQNSAIGYQLGGGGEFTSVTPFTYEGAYIRKVKNFWDTTNEEWEGFNNKFKGMKRY